MKNFNDVNNKSGYTILKNLSEDLNENVFISPLSINMALLTMLYGGDNNLKSKIEKFLEIDKGNLDIKKSIDDLLDCQDGEFSIAFSLWDRDISCIKKEFSDLFKKVFNGEINEFKSISKINKWVDQKTNHRIDKIVDDESVLKALVNAAYFNYKWKNQFNKNKTKNRIFYGLKKDKKIQFMTKTMELNYWSNSICQIVSIPYLNDFDMIVVLPNNIEDAIDDIENIINGFYRYKDNVEVELFMPKFEMKYQSELLGVFKQIGLNIMNNKLSDICDDFEFDRILHKSFINVDEEGTEAAAVTACTICCCNVFAPKKIIFDVNRPFLFFINKRDKENPYCNFTNVFSGMVLDL